MEVWPDREEREWRRADPHPGRPGPQPEGAGLRPAPQPAGRDHRPLRIGQEQPRLRHALRRGPAPLRREPVALGAAVPGADGAAGGRIDQWAVAGDRDRAADDGCAPALHGRHRQRGLRPPARAVRDARPSALPALRRADRGAERRGDGPAAAAPGERRGRRDRGAGGARPQGRLPQGAGRRARPRPAAGAGGRPGGQPARAAAARPAARAPHRRAGGPAGAAAGRRGPAARQPREGLGARGGRRARVRRGPRRTAAEPPPGLRALRRLGARAEPARLFLQQRTGRLPGVRRARPALDCRRRPRDPGRDEEPAGRGDPALAPPRAAAAARGALRGGGAPRLLARGPRRRRCRPPRAR